MIAEGIALETISEGSTYSGCEIEGVEEINGVDYPVGLTGANIIMAIKRKGTTYATYRTADGTLLISDTLIIIPPHVPVLTKGVYEFDFNVIMPNGDPFTGLAGGTWEVTEPITKR